MIQEIQKKAEEFGVPYQWAIDSKRRHLQGEADFYTECIDRTIMAIPGSSLSTIAYYHSFLANHTLRRRKFLDLLWLLDNPVKASEHSVTEEQIEVARQSPVESLLPNPVKHHRTQCFNHEDRHPSMQVNETYVYCHVCCKSWDSIAITMAVHGHDFRSAVKWLIKE